MRRIATVRPGGNVTAKSCCSAWPAVTTGATVDQSRAKCKVSVNVAPTVRADEWPLPLCAQELALEKLSSAPNRTEGVARDHERGRVRRLPVAAPGANFLRKGFRNAEICHVGILSSIRHLRPCGT